MKNAGLKLSVVALSCSFALSANAASTLFTNVDVFNGTENKLYEDHHVLVEDNLIKQISASPIEAGDAVVIDGEGKTLMPGLIDGHAHVMINYNFGDIETNKDLTDISIHATQVAKRYLDDGFTTVRDMGGPAFGLTREIEAGNVVGPRIYPSGAFISQTSGHGDFRDRSDPGFTPNSVGDISNFERMGIGAVADGVPEVLKATRLNLRNGATQIKIMA
ncbi:amidohydrolase family protein, partial [Vibrio splendidus]